MRLQVPRMAELSHTHASAAIQTRTNSRAVIAVPALRRLQWRKSSLIESDRSDAILYAAPEKLFAGGSPDIAAMVHRRREVVTN